MSEKNERIRPTISIIKILVLKKSVTETPKSNTPNPELRCIKISESIKISFAPCTK
jgi:hypothetical protein